MEQVGPIQHETQQERAQDAQQGCAGVEQHAQGPALPDVDGQENRQAKQEQDDASHGDSRQADLQLGQVLLSLKRSPLLSAQGRMTLSDSVLHFGV